MLAFLVRPTEGESAMKKRNILSRVLAISVLAACLPSIAPAQDSDLAKAAQNPIANMISLPFQNNVNFGIGPNNRTQNVLNIQPVIPFKLSDDWLLVTRWIMPVIYQPDILEDSGGRFGLGDLNPSFFFVPSARLTGLPKELLIGFGPAVKVPTATSRRLGAQKWGAGPSVVAVYSKGKWVLGGLINNIWSIGDGANGTNSFLLQPFINYNLPGGWYLTTSPVITANWNAADSDRWTIPIGGGVGKIFRIGKQAMNAQVAAYYNVVRPDYGADWQLRVQLQFLFPK